MIFKSLLESSIPSLQPKTNYFLCEFCQKQLETLSQTFFATNLNELDTYELINQILLFFRTFNIEIDQGLNPEIFVQKHILHFNYNNTPICRLNPIELYTILKKDISIKTAIRSINQSEFEGV